MPKKYLGRKRWVPAPYTDGHPSLKGVAGVYLTPDESVEWVFHRGEDGRRYVAEAKVIKVHVRIVGKDDR